MRFTHEPLAWIWRATLTHPLTHPPPTDLIDCRSHSKWPPIIWVFASWCISNVQKASNIQSINSFKFGMLCSFNFNAETARVKFIVLFAWACSGDIYEKVSIQSNLYIARWPRYIQGDCYIQVSFKLYWKLMNNVFMWKYALLWVLASEADRRGFRRGALSWSIQWQAVNLTSAV